MSHVSRRSFLQTSSAVAGASLLATGSNVFASPLGANDRLRIAVVGLNGRGRAHIAGWLGQKNVELAYVIDPDEDVLNRTLKNINTTTKGKVTPEIFAKHSTTQISTRFRLPRRTIGIR